MDCAAFVPGTSTAVNDITALTAAAREVSPAAAAASWRTGAPPSRL
jgi:hypothetical protein